MINLLRICTFVKDGNSVKMQQKRGPRLLNVLPTNYQLEKKDDIFLPPPLDFFCLKTANIARNFSKLFSKAHLQLIHSTYLGPQGLREGSTKTQYFHNAFVDILPRNIKKAFATDPYVMKMSLSKYATNFEVMWSDLKRPLKVLNRLLDILLKIHLAPEREQKYKAYVARKKKEMEQKRQLKRLAVFRSILRQVIFKYHGQHITEAEVRDISNTTYTQEEIRVLILIANFLMPYIPTKQTRYTTAYQIPFILMSNDTMRDTGYQKSCVAVSP
ncbi:hypothetical protein EDC94DRAFT_650689 [Helicostylum pulchrum]|nr:hypothetical protein EDC94DRAFT_650689 [Helicostylum pulchrum]